MFQQREILIAASAVALALFTCKSIGCSGGPDDKTGPDPVVEAETVDLDGLVLMKRGVDGNIDAVNLIDPTTGEASPVELRHRDFALAPDAQTIALVGADGGVQVARFIIDGDDLPSFEFVARWEKAGEESIEPTFLPGVWLGKKAVYDTNTGEKIPCLVDRPEDWRTVDPRCRRLRQRKAATSPDEQFGPPGMTHLPTGVRLAEEAKPAVGFRPNSGDIPAPLPDGRVAGFPVGRNGKYVVRESGGFRNVYRVYTATDLPVAADAYRLTDVFDGGEVDVELFVELSSALNPYLKEGEGRSFTPSVYLPNGEVVYSIKSWVLESSESLETVEILQKPIHRALVAVSPDGDVRAMEWRDGDSEGADNLPGLARIDQRPEAHIPALLHHRALYFGGDDWLVGGLSWAGYLDGEAVQLADVGVPGAAGGWFVGNRDLYGPDPALCFRPVRASAKRTCIPQPTVGKPVTIVAQGVRKSEGPPVVTTTSKTAVWPGGEVVVFGSRFGKSGTVRLGDRRLGQEHIVEWTDYAVRFRTPDDMPERAPIRIERADGSTSGGGPVHPLFRTKRATTPLEGLDRGPHAVGQGLNLVDVGLTDLDLPSGAEPRFAPEPNADGQYVVYSREWTADDALRRIEVTKGDYRADIVMRVEDRMADDEHWQPVGHFAPSPLPLYFDHLADSLVEVSHQRRPYLIGRHPFVDGERVRFGSIREGVQGFLTLYWRQKHDQKAAYVMPADGRRVTLRRLTGFGDHTPGGWGLPRLADSPDVTFDNGALHFDAHGQTVLVVGDNQMEPRSAAYQLSHDGGQTLQPRVLAADELGRNNTSFVEPIALEHEGSPAFLVFEPETASEQHTHLITTDGKLEQDVADSLPVSRPLRPVTDGSAVTIYAPTDETVVHVDLADQEPTWRFLPSDEAEGRVSSFFHDPADGSLYILLDDGSLQRAAAGDWRNWQRVDLGVETVGDLKLTPRTVAKLKDGRWMVGAEVQESDGSDWVFGNGALFVSPEAK